MRIWYIFLESFLLAALATTANVAFAHDGQEHGDKAPIAAAPSPTAASAQEVLDTISAQQQKLISSVSAKRLSEVHAHAFAIRASARLLPALAAAQRRARVEGLVANISTLSEQLDNSGDAGDQSRTELNLIKMEALLDLLSAQFPKAQ